MAMDVGGITGAIHSVGSDRQAAINKMKNANNPADLMEGGMQFQEAQIKMDTLQKSATQAIKAAGDALKDSIDKSA